MACFDIGIPAYLTDCWGFGPCLKAQLTRLTPGEVQAAYADIETHFDAYLADPAKTVGVPFNYPGAWPDQVAPLYFKACGKNEKEAAKMLGNMYCQVAIGRAEVWLSLPANYIRGRPRHYRVDAAVNRAKFGI